MNKIKRLYSACAAAALLLTLAGCTVGAVQGSESAYPPVYFETTDGTQDTQNTAESTEPGTTDAQADATATEPPVSGQSTASTPTQTQPPTASKPDTTATTVTEPVTSPPAFVTRDITELFVRLWF